MVYQMILLNYALPESYKTELTWTIAMHRSLQNFPKFNGSLQECALVGDKEILAT